MSNFLNGLLLVFVTSPAFAEETIEVSELLNMDLGQLLQVKVTARKAEEPLLNVPLSISVLNTEQLEQADIRSLTDLSRHIPGMFSETRNDFGIRGVFTGTPNVGISSGNSLFIDGVYSLNNFDIEPLIDTNRIEILKGPQSTFFGRNTISGAINIVPNEPEFNNNKFSLRAATGEDNSNWLELIGNYQLNSNNAIRVATYNAARDGYITNSFNGEDLEDEQLNFVRAQWQYKTEKLRVSWSNDYSHKKKNGLLSQLRRPPDAQSQAVLDAFRAGLGLTATDTPTSSLTVSQDTNRFNIIESWGSTLTFDYSLNSDESLNLTTARRSLSNNRDNDEDDLLPIFLITTPGDNRWLLTSAELRYVNTSFENWSFTSGLYFENQAINSKEDLDTGVLLLPLLGVNQLETAHIDYDSKLNVESQAIFVAATYAVNNQTKIDFESRFHSERKNIIYRQTGACFTQPGDLQGFCFFPQIDHEDKSSDTKFLPSISVSSNNGNNRYWFGRVSSGFKAGGFSADLVQSGVSSSTGIPNVFFPTVVNDVDLRLDEENIVNFELGYRGIFLSHQNLLTATLFHMNFTDFQTSRFTGTEYVPVNAGEAHTTGFEFELTRPISENTSIAFGGYLAESEYDEFIDGDDAQGNEINHKGNHLVFAPETSFFARFHHSASFSDSLEWHLNANWNYRSEYFTQPNNATTSKVNSTQRLNMKLGLVSANKNWSVFLVGNNLTNEIDEVRNQVNQIFGLAETKLTRPRNYEIQFSYQF